MIDRYNEYADRHFWKQGELLQRWILRRTLRTILSVVDIDHDDVRIAELGPGLGVLAELCESSGFSRYVGFEPNPGLVSIVQSKLVKGNVVNAALPSIPPKFLNSFDLVVAIHVLEHASTPQDARDWLLAARNLAEVGGYVVIISPDIHDYGPYFWEIDWSHAFPTTSERISQVGRDVGLTVVRSATIRGGSFGWLNNIMLRLLSAVFPTRLANSAGSLIVGRKLGTGLQSALLWRNSFVVLQRSTS